MEILPQKVEEANKLYRNLEELVEKRLKKLKDDEKEALPKFGGKFDEGTLIKYFEEVTKSIKNPIRFRRKRALVGLEICGMENIKDEIFDDDGIEETIQILQDIKSYGRLFKILSPKIPSLIIAQSNINNVNSRLKDIKTNIESLKKVEEIRSEYVKDHCLQKYINGELNIYKINDIKEKVIEIEENLNLQLKQEEEIHLIDGVCTLINSVNEYGKKFKERCSDLNGATEKLQSYKDKLEYEYKQIKRKIDFWREMCSEVYIPEIKNIDTLMNALKKLKEKCKEEYKSFEILKQIYDLKLNAGMEKLRECANELDKIIPYFPNLKIRDQEGLDATRRIYKSVVWLEKAQYPNVEELCKKYTFEKTEEFFKEVTQIKEEYTRLKEDLKVYQQILAVEEEQIDVYPLLRQKINECRDKLQHMVGEGFESLVGFLKGNIEDIEVDEQTLKNFIKTVRPILREALRI